MKTVIGKSFAFSIISIIIMYACRILLKTDTYLSDVGGIQSFLGVFGTLYGIMAAFVVFEVWGQYNKTVGLIEHEAHGLEKLFRLTLYFRDETLTKEMKKAIEKYANIIIQSKFQHLGSGQRSKESSRAFREISKVIRSIKFDDDHDQMVFSQIVPLYEDLADTRTERINQSLARLPFLLKVFVYTTSLFALLFFILMPFANMYYGFIATGFLAFIIAMVLQLIEDLDNPFVGYWNITPEPFERVLDHIEKDY
jgi:hypothetical protein